MRRGRRSRPKRAVAIATALLAIVAGAAIALLTGDQQGEDVVVSSPAPDSTDPVASTTITAAPGTVPTTSDPLPSTTVPTSTTAPTTSTTVPSSTTAATSTTVPTTSTTVPPSTTGGGLLPRADLDVATANASGVNGVAGAAAERLFEIGYSTVSAINASSPEGTSVVYYQPDLLEQAVRLAVDLGWTSDAVAPVDQMPALDSPQVFELVAVIGTDRATA